MSSVMKYLIDTNTMFPHLIFVTIVFSFVTALPAKHERVVGGTVATIQEYPYSASLLYTWDYVHYDHRCGGTILNYRAVLTTAHCVIGNAPIKYRIRVGSSNCHYGGIVHNSSLIIIHPKFKYSIRDNDVALVHSATNFIFSEKVQVASIAGANYNFEDNAPLWVIGWGSTTIDGPYSDVLHHVQVWSVNYATCKSRYTDLQLVVTESMFCSGWLDVGGRDQCWGDEGSPVIHNNVVVGVRSWGMRCGLARYPGVSSRVSRFAAWIYTNA